MVHIQVKSDRNTHGEKKYRKAGWKTKAEMDRY